VADFPEQQEDVEQAKNTLLDGEWLKGVRGDQGGSLRAAISNAMVGLKKEYYGKGPVKAKTYINDNIIFCVLQGGLTRNEETLLSVGEDKLVRQFRLRFQGRWRLRPRRPSRSSPAGPWSRTTARSCSTRITHSRSSSWTRRLRECPNRPQSGWIRAKPEELPASP
jgi:hypothetical protein